MGIEILNPGLVGEKRRIWDQWVAKIKSDLAGGGKGGAVGSPGGGGGNSWNVGILDPGDSNSGAYDFPTWNGWGGGAGAPISFGDGFVVGPGGIGIPDGAFGPGNIFQIGGSQPKEKKPAKGPLDWGGWKRAAPRPGPVSPGSKYGGGSNAPPPSVRVLPLHRDGTPDRRFEAKEHDREQLLPDFPGGTRTITLETTDERRQQFLTYHADPRLVAANRGPSPSYGTPVADLTSNGDLSGTRHAALQTMMRVVKSPGRAKQPGQTTDQSAAEMPNSLSWNIGLTGLEEALSGLVTDNSYGRNRHARVARVDGGAFAVGPRGCKHRLGGDGDNDPILPLHLPCEALFSWDDSDARLDGPFAINPLNIGTYEPRSGYVWRVDSCWDPGWNYLSGSASHRGAWGWRVNVPIGTTTPTTPKDPPPTHTPPPPTTPGGDEPPTTPPGGPPPPPPTTPGGPRFTQTTGPSGGGGAPKPPPPPAPAPLRIDEGDSFDLTPRDYAAMATALGATAMIFRPRLMATGARDLAFNGLDATMEELKAFEVETPAVLRIEAYGRQGGTAGGDVFGASSVVDSSFIRTQERGKSRHRGGTARGGLVFLPPEVGLDLVDANFEAENVLTPSSSFVVVSPGVSLGFGMPDIPSGSMRTGFAIRGSTDGSLSFRQLAADATDSDYMTWLDSGQMTFTVANKWSFENASGMQIGTVNTQKIGFWGKAPAAQDTGWSVGAYTPRRNVDNTMSLAQALDAIATIIQELGLDTGMLGA